MDVVRRHGVVNVDVERANFDVRTIVVQYEVEHAVNTLDVGYLLHNLLGELSWDAGAQQFVDRGGEHLDTGLDDDQ